VEPPPAYHQLQILQTHPIFTLPKFVPELEKQFEFTIGYEDKMLPQKILAEKIYIK